MLAHCVTNCEEHREALTAQQESVIAPLVCHLASGEAPLVHNATLLLGHCLMTNSEFRQTFAKCPGAAYHLVTAMSSSSEPAIAMRATWAIRHFFSDPACELSEELLDLTQTSLVFVRSMHSHERIQKHVAKLTTLVQQRKAYLEAIMQRRQAEQTAPSPRSSTAVEALTCLSMSLSEERPQSPASEERPGSEERPVSDEHSAISALSSLEHDRGEDSGGDSESSPSASPSSLSPEGSPSTVLSLIRSKSTTSYEASSPTSKKHSPRGRGTMLAPWKKHSSQVQLKRWKTSMVHRF